MRIIWTGVDDVLALNPERKAAMIAAGVKLLEFGQDFPRDGIQLIDSRPKGFVGCRRWNDPCDTAIMLGGRFSGKCLGVFKDFNRALKRAQKLAAIV